MSDDKQDYSSVTAPLTRSFKQKELALNYLRGQFPNDNEEDIKLLAKYTSSFKDDYLRNIVMYIKSSRFDLKGFISRCTEFDIIVCLHVILLPGNLSNPDALEVMRISAYLNTKDIPDRLLISWFINKFDISEAVARQRFDFAILKLMRYVLIEKSDDDMFSIASFIHQEEASRRNKLSVGEDNEDKLIKTITYFINNIFNTELAKDIKDIAYIDNLLLHIKVLGEHLRKIDVKSLSLIQIAIGNYYRYIKEDYQEGLKYYLKAELILKNIDKRSKQEQTDYANLSNEIKVISDKLGKRDESTGYHKQALKIREELEQ